MEKIAIRRLAKVAVFVILNLKETNLIINKIISKPFIVDFY